MRIISALIGGIYVANEFDPIYWEFTANHFVAGPDSDDSS